MRYCRFMETKSNRPPFIEFIRAKVGPNWVVARRTARIVRKYGEDVVALSQSQFTAIKDEYVAKYGAF